MTTQQLLQNTNKVHPDSILNGRSGTGMRVVAFKKTKFKGTKVIEYFGTIMSQYEQRGYSTIIWFQGLKDVDKDIPNLDKTTVRVRCSCKNFYFMFEYWNKVNNSLAGGPHKTYVRKTTTYPERNPEHLPGMCKHLVRILISMKSEKLVVGGSI
jgi:hypothetical protein